MFIFKARGWLHNCEYVDVCMHVCVDAGCAAYLRVCVGMVD